MRFENKVAFITGGGSGIGKDAAYSLAKEGAQIAIADWNREGGEAVVEQLVKDGVKAQFYQLDVRDYQQVVSVMNAVKNNFGRIDIALNNAGLGAPGAEKTAEKPLSSWDLVIGVNQTGVFYCMKEELRIMQEQGNGTIINISSVAGLKALPRQVAYVASKHAVIGMTKTAALEYAKTGIRINAVCPVFTRTPLVDSMFEHNASLEDKLVHLIPVGRYGEVSDISNAILWLADDNSAFVTGLCLPIDGGLTA